MTWSIKNPEKMQEAMEKYNDFLLKKLLEKQTADRKKEDKYEQFNKHQK